VAFRLRMPAQIGDWLADLAGADPESAAEVGAALLALAAGAALPGPPLVTGREPADRTDDAGLRAAMDAREALDVSYQRLLEGLQRVRREVADVATAVRAADDALGRARLVPDADPAQLAAAEERIAGLRRDRDAVASTSQRMQAAVDAFRTRKETAKALAAAAEARLRIEEALAAAGLDPAEGELSSTARRHDEAEVSLTRTRTYAATLTAHLADDQGTQPDARPRSSNQPEMRQPSPAEPDVRKYSQDDGDRQKPGPDEADAREPSSDGDGLRELRADRLGADIRVLFAEEPAGTITVLAVLEGAAIRDHRGEALSLAAGLLAAIRAGGWPPPGWPPADDDDHHDADMEFDAAGPFLARFFPYASGHVAARAADLGTAVSLASLREQRGLSVTELASRAGTIPDRLMFAERKLEHASVPEVAAYVRALGGSLRLTASIDGLDYRLG
jgi:hypothetical protein